MKSIGFAHFPWGGVNDSVINQCSDNFSSFYGVWEDTEKGRVKMGPRTVRANYLNDENCRLVVAFDGGLSKVVGHAFYKRFSVKPAFEQVTWITQLVVHPSYRNKKIAQNMLHVAVGANSTCAGIATTHPYAVMALEKAMGQRVNMGLTRTLADPILRSSGIGYLQNKELNFADEQCLINTEFAVDHSEPQAALDGLPPGSWLLGPLRRGHEFVAVVFKP